MTDFFFDDFIKQITEFRRKQIEETERTLTEIIENYDFMVGSADLKGMLAAVLPDGANIIYSPCIQNPTTVYAIKKFDMMDYLLK